MYRILQVLFLCLLFCSPLLSQQTPSPAAGAEKKGGLPKGPLGPPPPRATVIAHPVLWPVLTQLLARVEEDVTPLSCPTPVVYAVPRCQRRRLEPPQLARPDGTSLWSRGAQRSGSTPGVGHHTPPV